MSSNEIGMILLLTVSSVIVLLTIVMIELVYDNTKK